MNKKMKKNKLVIIISIIVGLLIIVIVGLGIFGVMASADDLYNTANKISADESLTLDGKNIYYYYQPECHYCNDVKPDVKKFKDEADNVDIGFNVIDMTIPENTDYWYDSSASGMSAQDDPNYNGTPESIHEASDIKISGTPTMIYANGDDVKSINLGYGVYEVMNYALKDSGSDLVIENRFE